MSLFFLITGASIVVPTEYLLVEPTCCGQYWKRKFQIPTKPLSQRVCRGLLGIFFIAWNLLPDSEVAVIKSSNAEYNVPQQNNPKHICAIFSPSSDGCQSIKPSNRRIIRASSGSYKPVYHTKRILFANLFGTIHSLHLLYPCQR